MMKKLFCWLFILCLLTTPFRVMPALGASTLDKRIEAEEKKRKELSRKIAGYRKSIKEMGSKVESLLDKIDTLKQDESVAGQELAVLELQNRKLQDDLAVLNKAMSGEQKKIDELTGQMKRRLVDMYKYGASEEMNLVIASENVFEASRAVHLLQVIARHDAYLLSQLQDRYQNMNLSRTTMDIQRAQLREQSQALQAQRNKYQRTINETNTFISSIQKQKALAEKASRETEEAQKAVGRTITTLMQRKKEQQNAQKKKTGGKASHSGADYLAGRGRGSMFDWPVRGKITSQYGQRIHPVFKTKIVHSGLDIAAPANTPVKAAAAGEVLFDGWLRGYGQVLILDHGRNYTTVYAHLNSTSVKEGQVVKAGSVIGQVGKTGTATGYHLHFEVRVNGVTKNPMNYLKR
ncbi:MAG: peptidoglycan DD-metalloendopeptidase family protein [Fretibacterium sp.]|nr:peptidoglycan DD-metalloendopeptidase family protein [Fretibacterium sp.]